VSNDRTASVGAQPVVQARRTTFLQAQAGRTTPELGD
jgi:hypothetical protein